MADKHLARQITPYVWFYGQEYCGTGQSSKFFKNVPKSFKELNAIWKKGIRYKSNEKSPEACLKERMSRLDQLIAKLDDKIIQKVRNEGIPHLDIKPFKDAMESEDYHSFEKHLLTFLNSLNFPIVLEQFEKMMVDPKIFEFEDVPTVFERLIVLDSALRLNSHYKGKEYDWSKGTIISHYKNRIKTVRDKGSKEKKIPNPYSEDEKIIELAEYLSKSSNAFENLRNVMGLIKLTDKINKPIKGIDARKFSELLQPPNVFQKKYIDDSLDAITGTISKRADDLSRKIYDALGELRSFENFLGNADRTKEKHINTRLGDIGKLKNSLSRLLDELNHIQDRIENLDLSTHLFSLLSEFNKKMKRIDDDVYLISSKIQQNQRDSINVIIDSLVKNDDLQYIQDLADQYFESDDEWGQIGKDAEELVTQINTLQEKIGSTRNPNQKKKLVDEVISGDTKDKIGNVITRARDWCNSLSELLTEIKDYPELPDFFPENIRTHLLEIKKHKMVEDQIGVGIDAVGILQVVYNNKEQLNDLLKNLDEAKEWLQKDFTTYLNSYKNDRTDEYEQIKKVCDLKDGKACYQEIMNLNPEYAQIHNTFWPASDVTSLDEMNKRFNEIMKRERGGFDKKLAENIETIGEKICKDNPSYSTDKPIRTINTFIDEYNKIMNEASNLLGLEFSDFSELSDNAPPYEVMKKVEQLTAQFDHYKNEVEKNAEAVVSALKTANEADAADSITSILANEPCFIQDTCIQITSSKKVLIKNIDIRVSDIERLFTKSGISDCPNPGLEKKDDVSTVIKKFDEFEKEVKTLLKKKLVDDPEEELLKNRDENGISIIDCMNLVSSPVKLGRELPHIATIRAPENIKKKIRVFLSEDAIKSDNNNLPMLWDGFEKRKEVSEFIRKGDFEQAITLSSEMKAYVNKLIKHWIKAIKIRSNYSTAIIWPSEKEENGLNIGILCSSLILVSLSSKDYFERQMNAEKIEKILQHIDSHRSLGEQNLSAHISLDFFSERLKELNIDFIKEKSKITFQYRDLNLISKMGKDGLTIKVVEN